MDEDAFNGLYPRWLKPEFMQDNKKKSELEIKITHGGKTSRLFEPEIEDIVAALISSRELLVQDGTLYCRLYDYFEVVDDAFLTYLTVAQYRHAASAYTPRWRPDLIAVLREQLLAKEEIHAIEKGVRLIEADEGLYWPKKIGNENDKETENDAICDQ